MKLSEIPYEDMKKILAAIAAEIKPLLGDDEFMELFGDMAKAEYESSKDYGRRIGDKLLTALHLILNKHHMVLDKIFCLLFKCSQEELNKKTTKEMNTLIKDLLDDEVFVGFLPRLGILARSAS